MQRKNMMVLMISLSLVLLLGSSYALLRSTQVGTTPYVINVGTLQVTFDSGKTEKLSLENMYPMSDKEGMNQTDELGFTVENTGTVGSYYDVYLEETSTNPEFKSVIRFISNKNNQGYNEPKTLSEDKYIDVGGYIESNASSSYKVKVWLDYDADNTYMDKTFTAKVVVNSFQESNYAKDIIKSKLVKYSESSKEDFTGGLVAVNTDGDLYNETEESQEIREYRYSGPTVNNYVTFNDELWRIIGVFKDEVGKEHVKIVRNEGFKVDVFPIEYTINGTTYKIRYPEDYQYSGDYAYWNINTKLGERNSHNDWTTAGLQYWLNTKSDDNNINKGYLSYLKGNSENMIEEVKYYLGTVTVENTEKVKNIDTPKEAYLNERDVESCVDNTGKNVTESGCKVWNGNKATWKGKIAFLYPSDYGFSTIGKNWNIQLKDFSNIKSSSWLNSANHLINEWLLSPSTIDVYGCSGWLDNGYVYGPRTNYAEVVRPTLYLKSNVKITSGDGTSENPYQLEI